MTPEPKTPQMIAKYGLLFSTPLGIDVLEDIGRDCHFGQMLGVSEAQITLHNFFERLLSIIRGGDGVGQQESYIAEILRVPISPRPSFDESGD